MKILLVNDDGIRAEGLVRLEETLAQTHDVYVAAPETEQSACSHSITLRRPVQAREISDREFAVDGVPADCVNLALLQLFADHKFDLLISGINLGHNIGEDISYSGTVAGAIEATGLGVRSIALSIGYSKQPNFGPACAFVRRFLERFSLKSIPNGTFLNINIPFGEGPFEAVVTRQGNLHFSNSVAEDEAGAQEVDCPNATRGFRIHRTTEGHRATEGTDVHAVNNGYISITPMRLDYTDRGAFELTGALVRLAFGASDISVSASGVGGRSDD
ncbi:5'/3'-nucleotidase SurE [bacterium]|nr:5'/3'-nucleotidase SurE [bacterium]